MDGSEGMDGAETRLIDLKETTGRILGVDFGDTRTGLAVSDISRFLASGIGYISPGGIEKTAVRVAEIAREQKASAVVPSVAENSPRFCAKSWRTSPLR